MAELAEKTIDTDKESVQIQIELHNAEINKLKKETEEIDKRIKWHYRWSSTAWNIVKSVAIIFAFGFSSYNLSILADKKKVDEMAAQNAKFSKQLEMKKIEIDKYEKLNKMGKIVVTGIIKIHKKVNPEFYDNQGMNIGSYGSLNRGAYQGRKSEEVKAEQYLLRIYQLLEQNKIENATEIFKEFKKLNSKYITKNEIDDIESILSKKSGL